MSDDAVARTVTGLAQPILTVLARTGQRVTVTDVGAADGTLLRQLIDLWPDDLRAVTDWRAVDVRERPIGLDPRVTWLQGDIIDVAAAQRSVPGMVVAHELLDDIPCDIVEPDDEGTLHLVLVDAATGVESMGPALDDAEGCARWGIDGTELADWCATWWPREEPAARIEVGRARDIAWRSIRSLVTDGLAIAVDYGHVLVDRSAGRWDGGTLAGYVDGRPTSPVPDGSRNLTAHVALDACAAAAPAAYTRVIVPPGGDDFRWLLQSSIRLP